MRTMYLIGGAALLVAALVYFLVSKSAGEFLVFAVAAGVAVVELFWFVGKVTGAPTHPVEPTTTSEPHRPPDNGES